MANVPAGSPERWPRSSRARGRESRVPPSPRSSPARRRDEHPVHASPRLLLRSGTPNRGQSVLGNVKRCLKMQKENLLSRYSNVCIRALSSYLSMVSLHPTILYHSTPFKFFSLLSLKHYYSKGTAYITTHHCIYSILLAHLS